MSKVKLSQNHTLEMVSSAKGFKLCSYLVALEGWRRGLTLKWYVEDYNVDMKKAGKYHFGRIFSLESENKKYYFYRSRGNMVTNESVSICQSKQKTKKYLIEAGIPVPEGKKFNLSNSDGDLVKYANELGYPVVLKPTNGSMGKGVYTNIQSEEEFRAALSDLKAEYNFTKFIIERYLPGEEYRVYVVGDKVVAATNRIPANVVGDGKNTIEQLIKIKNKERKKNPYLAAKPIEIDFELLSTLKRNGYTIESIPSENEVVNLRVKSNLSSGGDPIDVTDELTDEVKQIAIKALKALPQIQHGGIDVIVDPTNNKKGYIIEINATAEIGFHLFPLEGKFRDVPKAIIDLYFPETKGIRTNSMYFDLEKILYPLETKSANIVEVASCPVGELKYRNIKITGKFSKDYLNWIRKKSSKAKINGFVKQISANSVQILINATDEKELDVFTELIKEKRENVDINEFSILEEEIRALKIGFEVIELREAKSKKMKDNKKADTLKRNEESNGLRNLLKNILK